MPGAEIQADLKGSATRAETLRRSGRTRTKSRGSNHWLTLNRGNEARVDIACELIHGEMAGDSQLGGSRSDGRCEVSRDFNPWLTLSCGNETSVDFTFELIPGELAGSGQSVERHVGS
jgi:hypothetical protein